MHKDQVKVSVITSFTFFNLLISLMAAGWNYISKTALSLLCGAMVLGASELLVSCQQSYWFPVSRLSGFLSADEGISVNHRYFKKYCLKTH